MFFICNEVETRISEGNVLHTVLLLNLILCFCVYVWTPVNLIHLADPSDRKMATTKGKKIEKKNKLGHTIPFSDYFLDVFISFKEYLVVNCLKVFVHIFSLVSSGRIINKILP